jgi:hypothetical protein
MTPGGFSINDAGEQVFSNVPAGTYTVTEAVKSGWSLTDITCGDDNSTGDVVTRAATVRLQAGETVICTFTNLQSIASPTNFVFDLSGAQEVPPTGSTARGGCYGQLDTVARRLAIVCTHNVVEATVMHIHNGVPGTNGPVVFDLGNPTSPVEATWNMTPAEMSELLAGHDYVNIHTAGRPTGEIRGQIVPRSVDRFEFGMRGSEEVPPTDSTATGNCVEDLSDDAASLLVQCTHTITNATAAHLHDAPPGVDGPVVFELPTDPSFSATAPLTPRLVADFAAGFLYVNIHSPAYDTGEIRGQPYVAQAAAAVDAIPTLSVLGLWMTALALAAIALWRAR